MEIDSHAPLTHMVVEAGKHDFCADLDISFDSWTKFFYKYTPWEWGFENVTFLCRLNISCDSEQKMYFDTWPLPQGEGDWEHDFPVQICKFNLIPRKEHFWKLTPTLRPTPSGWGLANMTFLCTCRHLMQLLEKMGASQKHFVQGLGSPIEVPKGCVAPPHSEEKKTKMSICVMYMYTKSLEAIRGIMKHPTYL